MPLGLDKNKGETLETISGAMNEQNEKQTQDPGGTPDAGDTLGVDGELRAADASAATEILVEQGAAEEELPEPDAEGVGDELSEQESELAALKEALLQAEAQASEYLDGWQRARAEFANYRRREELRREQAEAEIAARVLGQFLPVLDDLERAFLAVPPEVQHSSWVDGLSLVGQKMLASMEKEGVAPMPTRAGDPFDPTYHMAVLHSPCADHDEGQIAAVLQRGYMIGKRVLRPAIVQVSSGKSAVDTPAECEGGPEAAAEGPAEGPAEEPNDLTSSKV